eukprot:COSAG02_NODE_7973_length_2763_cov_365.448574_1_plen_49_part_10
MLRGGPRAATSQLGGATHVIVRKMSLLSSIRTIERTRGVLSTSPRMPNA